ncbi:serine protease [Deinococcus cavernae]|uniref:Serine protease n=1 Tax=Deinococcus cavernae TaxID=2320857 RepID=A0A418VA48_9DEIO|nr:S1C family serine protease [Deinococcus cavernae]RJF72922.1 serine protease [Deinococcus cavernae]
MTRIRHFLLFGFLFLSAHGQAEGRAEVLPSGVWHENPLLRAPLSGPEQTGLAAQYRRARPATFLIADCPPAKCKPTDGVGTGFLIGSDGTALTAYHVVFQVRHPSVMMSDGRRYEAQVIGYDDQHDLAVLKVKVPQGTPFLPLSAGAFNPGDAVMVIGNGGQEFLKAKTGRLLALDADAGRADFPPGTWQLSAPIMPGDSGAPVLNFKGEVGGVVSFLRVSSDTNVMAFAVPVAAHDTRLAALKKGLKRDAPIIGVGLNGPAALLFDLPASEFLKATRAQGLDLGKTPGAFFTSVTLGSPAARAGLKPVNYQGKGDVVTHVDGERVLNFSEFQYEVREHAPGETVTLTVLRGGKTVKLQMKLIGRATVKN